MGNLRAPISASSSCNVQNRSSRIGEDFLSSERTLGRAGEIRGVPSFQTLRDKENKKGKRSEGCDALDVSLWVEATDHPTRFIRTKKIFTIHLIKPHRDPFYPRLEDLLYTRSTLASPLILLLLNCIFCLQLEPGQTDYRIWTPVQRFKNPRGH